MWRYNYIIKKFIIVVFLIAFIGIKAAGQKHIKVKAVLTSYKIGDLSIDMSNDQNEWTEWYDAATFRIIKPNKWKSDSITIFFLSEQDDRPFRAAEGIKYKFIIENKYFITDPEVHIFDDALLELNEIKRDKKN